MSAPGVPVVSDTTGRWAGPAAIATPAYWRTHMRQPVRFGEVLDTLAEQPPGVIVEIGPGTALTTLARRHPVLGNDRQAVASMPHPADPAPEQVTVLTALGTMWRPPPTVWSCATGFLPLRTRRMLPALR
jgi:phthiocerol/phenolphthiocerol synthesis type-I polyketide synthase E